MFPTAETTIQLQTRLKQTRLRPLNVLSSELQLTAAVVLVPRGTQVISIKFRKITIINNKRRSGETILLYSIIQVLVMSKMDLLGSRIYVASLVHSCSRNTLNKINNLLKKKIPVNSLISLSNDIQQYNFDPFTRG